MALQRRPNVPNPPAWIDLVPVGKVDGDVLDRLRADLVDRFGTPVGTGEPLTPDPSWFDAARGQYHADSILDALVAARRPDAWTLGIVDADLYVSGLNFIFGQATVGGCCAVIGLARLRDPFRGGPPDADRFHRRVLTEACHELGHIAGLDHCPDPRCVMHFSETIEDSDRKGPDFCPRCTP